MSTKRGPGSEHGCVCLLFSSCNYVVTFLRTGQNGKVSPLPPCAYMSGTLLYPAEIV